MLERHFKLNKDTHDRGCIVCGAATEVSLTVQVRGAGEHRKENLSQTRSFCRKHAKQQWPGLMDSLNPPSK